MRLWIGLFLVSTVVLGDGAKVPRAERVRSGLLAPDRAAREAAGRLARQWARTDPAGVDALYPHLDLRGRVSLVRALASAGTRNGAMLALTHAAAPEDAVFRAIVVGLGEGGTRSVFAPVPKGIALSKTRQRALEQLRLRWMVEAGFASLKSRSGRTGHYTGQYRHLKKYGEGAIEVMWHIVRDRAWPQPGEASGEQYRPLHPAMLDFDLEERRTLAAYSFGELIPKSSGIWKVKLLQLFNKYWFSDEDVHPVEKLALAPALAYSLHDLGIHEPAVRYIKSLEKDAAVLDFDGLQAMWDLGYAHMRIGQFEEGEDWYKRVIRLQDDWGRGVACYNLACHFAVRAASVPTQGVRFKKLALEWLELAILRHNFIDWVWMEEDGDLNSIRKETRYVVLRDALRRRYPAPKRHRKIEKDPKKFLRPEQRPPR